VRVTPVDAVGLEARAKALGGRSIKRESKAAALDLAIRCCDLTTLEGADTPGKVKALCAKAIRPDPTDRTVPSVAAVCVYPTMVPVAAEAVRGSGVLVASVAGAFPSGLGPLETRVDEIRRAVAAGADEIDMVLNRSAFLSRLIERPPRALARASSPTASTGVTRTLTPPTGGIERRSVGARSVDDTFGPYQRLLGHGSGPRRPRSGPGSWAMMRACRPPSWTTRWLPSA
jgi:hypothetical protein